MLKNIIPKDNIPKIEEVREINAEIPTYEEFMKTYQGNDKIISSYQSEYEAQAVNGPQYGPGRSDFSDLCRRIKNESDSNLTCRISGDSDNFYSWKNYAGVIVYAVDGRFKWVFSNNRVGRSFSMIIKCTDDWGSPGIGGFHASIIRDKFGFDLSYNNNKVCCGGFVWRDGALRFNSYALNSVDQVGCSSDGSGELSYYEKELVRYCFEKYRQMGSDYVFEIPSYCLP